MVLTSNIKSGVRNRTPNRIAKYNFLLSYVEFQCHVHDHLFMLT